MVLRRAVLWLVMLALVAAQALGLAHSVLHAPHGPANAHASAQAGAPAAEFTAAKALPGLFTGHDDDATCRLYDQLGHGDALAGVPAVVLPLLLPAFLIQVLEGDFVARWAALFDARGPPPVR